MTNLIAACAFFLLIHFGVSGTRVRDALVARLGAGPFRGLFSLASLGGLAWMIEAYRHAPTIETWGTWLAFRPTAYVLVFLAFLLGGIGILTPGPTRVGMESRLGPEAVRGMIRITRHPFLWAVALWAGTHFAVNGDLASAVLFGSLLVLSLGGTLSIDAKRRRHDPERWPAFAAATSSIPFAAIARGKGRLGPALAEIGLARILAAVALYALTFYLHGRLGPPLT